MIDWVGFSVREGIESARRGRRVRDSRRACCIPDAWETRGMVSARPDWKGIQSVRDLAGSHASRFGEFASWRGASDRVSVASMPESLFCAGSFLESFSGTEATGCGAMRVDASEAMTRMNLGFTG